MTRKHAGLGIIVGSLAFLSGCALDVDLESTPDTVQVGAQVSHTIKVTNNSVCPRPASDLEFYPHLTPAEEAMLDEDIQTSTGMGDLTVAALCELETNGLPGLGGEVLDRNETAAPGERNRDLASGGAAGAAGLMCQPATDSNNIDFFDCTVDPLAVGAMATIELQVSADQVGMFRNVAATFSSQSGVCDGGTRAGQACSVEADCPEGGCDVGMCVGGNTPGDGCDETTECDGGECVNCNRCQIAGVCVGGAEQGSACLSPDECGGGLCLCGTPVDCTFTNVIAPLPPRVPVLSIGGWVGLIALLMTIAALTLRRRLARA